MYNCAIFDLDGTLLNTIEDLAIASNYALELEGYPTHEVEKYKHFVGDGRYKLIERILPEDKKDKETLNRVVASFDEYYGKHMLDKTKPYDGIIEMLDKLHDAGVKLAVVSNKPDKFAGDVVKTFFGDRFDVVFGHRDGYLTKPDPTAVLDVMKCLGFDKDECIYIGDSNVDIMTAKNAQVKSIGVIWGFRGEEELKNAGADFLAQNTKELLEIIIS